MKMKNWLASVVSSARLLARGIACVACCGVAEAATWSQDLVVPRGESLTLGSSYIGKTNTSMRISGALTLDFNDATKSLFVVPLTAEGKVPMSGGEPDQSKRVNISVGPEEGDNATLDVANAYLSGWVKEGVYLSKILIGENGGKGCVRLNPAGRKPGNLRPYAIDLSANARTDADVFDVLAVGYNSFVQCGGGHYVNHNAKPMRITFSNVENAGTVTAYGRLNIYGSSFAFSMPQAGGDIILQGSTNAPIYLESWYDYGGPRLFDDSATKESNLKACLRTAGNCNMIIGCGGYSYPTYLNATNVIWGHSGDLIFMQRGSADHGQPVIVSAVNALPYGPQTGNVVVRPYAAGATYAQNLRLDQDQMVNGIILEHCSYLTNTSASVKRKVVFGGGDGSGVAYGDFSVNGARLDYSKAGTGTLVLSNATFAAFAATGGVLRVACGMTATFGTLAATNVLVVVEDGATLTVGTLAADDASFDIAAGGAFNVTTRQCGDGAQERNVLPATLTTNTVNTVVAALDAARPLVKEGAGYTVCVTPADAHGAPLAVKGGILKMGGEVCHNPYWRFIAKKAKKASQRYTNSNYPSFDQTVYLLLGHFGQFAGDGSYSVGTMTSSNDGSSIGVVATALAAGAVTSRGPLFFWNTYTSWKNVTNQYPAVTAQVIDPIVGGGTAQLTPHTFVTETDAKMDQKGWFDRAGTSTTTMIDSWGSCLAFTNGVLSLDDPNSWEIVTWRQKDAWARKGTASYILQRAVNNENHDRPHPTHWELQSSEDGVTWETMDVRTDATFDLASEGLKLNAQFNYTFNRHVPYLLTAHRDAWHFETFGPVEVAKGATLDLDELPDANIAFNGLSVDLTAGAGTVTKFAAAANGTLWLAHPRDEDRSALGLKSRVVLPLTVKALLGTENLSTWKVYVDGRLSPASTVAAVDGALVVHTQNGTMLLVR